MELCIQKVRIQNETYWAIFERGKLAQPLCVITDLMAKRFFESYREQVKAK